MNTIKKHLPNTSLPNPFSEGPFTGVGFFIEIFSKSSYKIKSFGDYKDVRQFGPAKKMEKQNV